MRYIEFWYNSNAGTPDLVPNRSKSTTSIWNSSQQRELTHNPLSGELGADHITAIITSQPPRDWSGHELAVLLGVKPRNMLTQLREWALLGFFTRTGFGTYALNTPHRPASSTTEPDP